MDDPRVGRLIDETLLRLGRGDLVPPAVLTLLLRNYVASGRHDVGDALGSALARALEPLPVSDDGLDVADAADVPTDVEWLRLFVEASSLSPDRRLVDRACGLAAGLQARWPGLHDVGLAMQSVEACLLAAPLAASPSGHPTLVQAALDELERLIGLTYRPGHPLAGRSPASPGTQASAASALLAAYRTSGRLAYPMLAEELIQTARRLWYDEPAGVFRTAAAPPGRDREERQPLVMGEAQFVLNCDIVRALWQLAALHDDEDYRQHVAVGAAVDYARDAWRILDRLAPVPCAPGTAARYALALAESPARL